MVTTTKVVHNPCSIPSCDEMARNPHANYCTHHTKYTNHSGRKHGSRITEPMKLYVGVKR